MSLKQQERQLSHRIIESSNADCADPQAKEQHLHPPGRSHPSHQAVWPIANLTIFQKLTSFQTHCQNRRTQRYYKAGESSILKASNTSDYLRSSNSDSVKEDQTCSRGTYLRVLIRFKMVTTSPAAASKHRKYPKS